MTYNIYERVNISGLTPGRIYEYFAIARNKYGWSKVEHVGYFYQHTNDATFDFLDMARRHQSHKNRILFDYVVGLSRLYNFLSTKF